MDIFSKVNLEQSDGSYNTLLVGAVSEEVGLLLSISNKGNFQIASPEAGSINLESNTNIKLKPGNNGLVEIVADNTGDLDEVQIKATRRVEYTTKENTDGSTEEILTDIDTDAIIRLKINASELELNTEGVVDEDGDSAVDDFQLKMKTGRKESDSDEKYCQSVIKARSLDFRCMEHGGIAILPCGYDKPSKNIHHENKIKFESSRISDITDSDIIDNKDEGVIAPDYSIDTENINNYLYKDSNDVALWVPGGDGLEFGTFNNLHSSLFTKDYRVNKDGYIYGATRVVIYEDEDENQYIKNDGQFFKLAKKNKIASAAIEAETTAPNIVKADYVTLADDFKDIIDDTDPITWGDVIKAVKYLKTNSLI